MATRRLRTASAATFAALTVATAARVRGASRQSPLSNRLHRNLRVWRLSARNAARFAAMRVRRLATPAERRAALDERFAIRTAADVAKELGEMKGVLMKAGQLISFILETLPPEAQQALARLQASAAPMSPTLAAGVVAAELGVPPERAFLDWTDEPVAAASIGQVHRAVTHHGDDVAVKVQYPGVHEAIDSDLDAAETMYAMFSAMALKGLDAKGLVAELRDRMREELDYRLEARNLAEFGEFFAGHPWVRIPRLVPELSTGRILTTEWVDGMSFDEFRATASAPTKRRAGEVIWRFAQHAVLRHRAFNGDPHPGNYKFHHDGSVTFLDFGLVKRWQPGEWERLEPTLHAIVIHRDPERLLAAMRTSGFVQPDAVLDADVVYEYVSSPYEPYLSDHFTFSRQWMVDTINKMFDVRGPYQPVIESLNLPASFVILDRVVWGVNAILGKLEVSGPFRAMLLEYVAQGEPATDIGAAEAAWRAGTRS